ncbi:MAG: hypothetical protein KF858_11060 [Candidatus Sumerlaeia bacterium]|nr:hypothetical protein [Candidatus Sumerlaeia bacterium]
MSSTRITFVVGPEDLAIAAPLIERGSRDGLDPERVLAPLADRVVTAWTLYPYLLASQAGLDCRLSTDLPKEGILVASACSIPITWKPPTELTFVCTVADSPRRPYAQVLVYQNAAQVGETGVSRMTGLPLERFLRHPPQADLIPRDPTREARFERVGYFGKPANLAAELRSAQWAATLASRGIEWVCMGPTTWHDYSDVDAVVAIRSMGTAHLHDHKPATKLYNAWLAGVPAVLGAESAYRAERRSPLDYLEADSVPTILTALDRLRTDAALRAAMIAHGRARATAELAPEQLRAGWLEILTRVAPETHMRWQRVGALRRNLFFAERHLQRKWLGLRKRLGLTSPERSALPPTVPAS